MELPKRLNLSDSILKAAQEILDKSNAVKEETLVELRQTALSTNTLTPELNVNLRSRLATAASRGASLARRVAGGSAAIILDPILNSSPANEGEPEALRQNMSPEDRARHDRLNSGQEQGRFNDNDSPQATPQAQTAPQSTQSNDVPTTELPPITVTADRIRSPRVATRTAADDSADRLNAISLGQSVAERGGTPAPDSEPQNDAERDAANNMRRRRREIASEEVIHPRRKKKKLINPQIEFNPETKDVKEAVVTYGKIKSSKRITKALQDIISKGQAKEYKFEDGTTVKIEPAMARIALNKYNAMSDFDKAQAAKTMRNSYKEFLTSIR